MTALTKLFRTTTFRLSLTYLALFSVAAIVAIAYIYWNTTVLLSRQLNQTIDAELTGLAEQYRAGGLDQLVRTAAERSRTPGNSLYLVADKDGKQLAGNLSAVSPQLWDSLGPVEFFYTRPAPGGVERRLAFANVFRLPGGSRLIVGRDIEDRRELSRLIRSTMLWGLGVMALVGIGGGYWVSRRLLARIQHQPADLELLGDDRRRDRTAADRALADHLAGIGIELARCPAGSRDHDLITHRHRYGAPRPPGVEIRIRPEILSTPS